MADEEEEAGVNRESSEEHVAEMKERDKASLLVVDEDDNGGEEKENVTGMDSDEDELHGTKRIVRLWGTRQPWIGATHWRTIFCYIN